jgi:hypothetical protein
MKVKMDVGQVGARWVRGATEFASGMMRVEWCRREHQLNGVGESIS